MTLSLWQYLDRTGRNLAPLSVTVLLTLLAIVPLHLPRFTAVVPSLTIMSVYYWAIHRPDLLRPSVVFGIGLLEDFLSGAPLGFNALTLLAVHGVVINQRRFFLAGTFMLMWFGFTLIALGATVLQWVVYSALSASLVPIGAPVARLALTVALFPPLAAIFIRMHRAFLNG